MDDATMFFWKLKYSVLAEFATEL